MSKSPAFQWYAADYLADERVAQLTLEAEGVYVRLLSYCWREGSIPANLALLPSLCKYADVKVIKAALALFTKSPDLPGRLIHKRLEEERAKQEAFRAKQAEKGSKGGRPKKADGKPDESRGFTPALPEVNNGITTVKPDESSSISSSTSSSMSTEVDRQDAGEPASPPPLTSQKGGQKLRQHDDAPLFDPAEWPGLNDPARFAAICEKLGYGQVDTEIYRHQILAKLESKQLPASSLRNFIESYLNNHNRDNKLVLARAPIPNEVPSNAQSGAITGSTIPSMSSMLNPNWKQPTG